MKKAKSFILTLLVSLLSTVMYAQEFVCSGTVVDEQGEPIIGASVFLKGSKNGVFSDIKGEFRLENVAEGSPITISYIGCKTVETKAAAGMRVVMREDNEMLGEVVVVGYGVQKKSVVTASIAKVSSDELAATAPVRMDNALKGLAAGVTVTSSSGQPGAAARIRVRGIGTINNSDPLYIVDGMPIEGGLDYVNPSYIESIEVLKDAASGAIYGARAANGVVLVTTKSGKKGKVKVNYNFSYGWQSKWRKRDVLNATEYAVMMNEGYINAGMKPLYADPYHLKDAMGNQVTDGTDWQDAVFNDNAPVMNHDLTVSGATDKVNYYLSLGYYTQEGIVGGNFDRSNYQRLSLRSNTRYNVLDLSLFPYVSDDSQYDKPAFRIESVTGSKLVLVYDNGSIAWHYVLTSKDEVKGFDGFDADSEFNMFKGCTFTNEFYYAPGWNQIADPALTADGNSYTVSLPEATSDTWQAQVKFLTDMRTSAASHYDFSCKLMSNTDHNNVTVKLVKTGDDATYYFQETVSLKAYEEYVFYKSDMPGIDMDKVSLVLDFGGNAANTQVTVSGIVLKDHANDDGTVVPVEDEDKTVYTYDSADNLWKVGVDDKNDYSTEFFYAPGWTQIADPGFAKEGGTYTVTLPSATSDQWQAQVKIKTGIAAEADAAYDFCCTLMSDKELKGATVKLTDGDDDADNFFFTERADLVPYEEYVLKVPAAKLAKGASKGLMLVLDFGGCKENTTVKVSGIVLQKTAE